MAILTKDDLELIGGLIDKRLETHTVVIKGEIKAAEERVREEIKAVRAEMATKADIADLRAEVVKKLKSHERRINTLEDEADIPHPDKN